VFQGRYVPKGQSVGKTLFADILHKTPDNNGEKILEKEATPWATPFNDPRTDFDGASLAIL